MEINMLGTGFIDREEFIRLDYTSDSTWIIHKKKYIIVLKQYRPEKILIGRNQRVSWGEIAAFGREIRLDNIHASGEIRAPSARKKPQSNAFLKSYPLGITPIQLCAKEFPNRTTK